MKILHVIPSMNPKTGGPSEGVRQIDACLSELGHFVDVVSIDPMDSSFPLNHNGKLFFLGPGVGLYSYSKKLIPWLMHNGSQYDFVIINGVWQYTSWAACYALRKINVPYIIFPHGMLDPWFKKQYPIKHLKKLFYWWLFERKVLRDAKFVVFTCEEEKNIAPNSFKPYKANPVVVAYGTSSPPNNIEELKKVFYLRFPQLAGKRFALFLSRIHEKKGCDILIESFAKISKDDKSIYLVMAGPDDSKLAKKLKLRSSSLGLADRVVWTGMLQGEIKWGAFYSSEIFILPSHQENFGIVVAEALACGKPVLISNKVNIWREIINCKAGFVDEDDISGTLNNFRKWLAMSAEEYSEMSARATNCFNDKFHVRQTAIDLEKIGFSLIDKS